MTGRMTLASIALVLAAGAATNAGSPIATPPPGADVQHYHYAINARVRPLLLFWISRSGVGDAVATRRQGPTEAAYSLLIGSDPDRAPRRINRWGYINEEIRGTEATLIGLMTESDEDSIEQAEANIRKQAGDRTFKIIRATVDGDQARSVVTSIAAPDYSFRQVHSVLELAQHDSSEGKARVIHLPPGTRPGFLAALAELMHTHVNDWRTSGRVHPGGRIAYVYHGRIYELAVTRTQPLASVRIGGSAYRHVIASDFEIKSTYDGELTQFSMTYGAEGSLAETPLAASYQPRWWLQIELALDDTTSGPALASRLNP
jgi:hypothetical protein